MEHSPSNRQPLRDARSREHDSASGTESGADTRDTADLAELWSTLRQRRLAVLAIALVIFGAVMALTLLSRMQFVSSGRLYLGELDEKVQGSSGTRLPEFELASGGEGDVASEMEILKSRTLVKRAILASGLNVALSPVGATPLPFWKWLESGRDPNLLDVSLRELAAVNTSFSEDPLEARSYEVRFVNSSTYQLYIDGQRIGRGTLNEPLSAAGVELTLVPGKKRGPVSGARYQMVISPLEAVTDRVLEALEVVAPKSSAGTEPAKVVTVTFADTSPYLAAAFLEQLMYGYLQERQTWKTEDATAAEAFVTQQLREIQGSLDLIEKKLADYRSNNRVVVLDNEADAMIAQINGVEEQRIKAQLEVASLAEVAQALEHPDRSVEAYMVGEARDSVLEGLAASLSSARQELTDLEARFHPAAPEVREQREQVDAQLKAVTNYVASRLARARKNLKTLNGIVGQYERKLRTVPGAELRLAQLARQSEVYSALYSSLLERQQQAAITKASRVSKNRILDAPQAPRREDSPKLLLGLASAPLGLMFGALVVLVASFVSSGFQNEGDLRRAIGNLRIFGRVPWVKGHGRPDQRMSEPSPGAVPFEYVEAFRTLRANLHYAAPGPGKVVLITSPSSSDGKTTCALSLAAMLASGDKRVLLIDLDLRKPSHHLLLGESVPGGLRDVLEGEHSNWRETLRPVSGPFGKFFSLCGDQTTSAEILSEPGFAAFLAAAADCYDYILLDSASYPIVSDALVLVEHADCVLSVVRLRKTPRKLLTEHLRGLSSFDLPHGIIVNDAKSAGKYGKIYPSTPRAKSGKPPPPPTSSLRALRAVSGSAA